MGKVRASDVGVSKGAICPYSRPPPLPRHSQELPQRQEPPELSSFVPAWLFRLHNAVCDLVDLVEMIVHRFGNVDFFCRLVGQMEQIRQYAIPADEEIKKRIDCLSELVSLGATDLRLSSSLVRKLKRNATELADLVEAATEYDSSEEEEEEEEGEGGGEGEGERGDADADGDEIK